MGIQARSAYTGSLKLLGLKTRAGVPYIRPEIQLLYKARAEIRSKDQDDFDQVVPRLSYDAQVWLLCQLEKIYPQGHVWVTGLRRVMAKQSE